MKAKIILIYLFLPCLYIHAENISCCECGDQGKGSSETPKPYMGDMGSADLAQSADPNELHGPVGYDTLRWVSINDVLHYTILFENSEELASASAQIVDIRFRFPYPEMMNSFQLGEYNFALQNFPVKTESNAYKSRMDMRDNMFIYVDLNAGLDIPNQQAYWHFSSIDPQTGIAPWQFDRGLLPVNDSTHAGEGYVTFSMKPDPSMQTGDTIGFFASILFDQNDTIPTNWWCNKIDAGAPQSAIVYSIDEANTLLYHLNFTASDDIGGCGVKQIHLYREDNWGTWQEVAAFSPDTTFDQLLELGESCKLICIAEDYVGNREPFKSAPDLVLNANLAPTDILLSDSTFRDDLRPNGYIATLTTIDNEETGFVYALSEGEGAIHNDLFMVDEDHLLLRNSLRCAPNSDYFIRVSSTDKGGLTYSKAFHLYMTYSLSHPKPDTTRVSICEGEIYTFMDSSYTQAGTYLHTKFVSEEMCDSSFVLELTILPPPQKPVISIENGAELVSSASYGNRWILCDDQQGQLVATDNRFIPYIAGQYYVVVDNDACPPVASDTVTVQFDQDSISLTLNLEAGWNWFSSNLADAPNCNLQSFLLPIRSSVDSVCGNEPNVNFLNPAESYKIRTNQSLQHTWTGLAYDPKMCTISLQQGWNRIGYPLSYVSNLSNTWEDFTPQEGDIIKTYEEFSVFHGGQWIGTLSTLSPGDGLMYYTQSARTMRFSAATAHINVYPVHHRLRSESLPQNTAIHQYPDNTTIIATLKNYDDSDIPEGMYTVMAYVGNVVIGVGSYVEGRIYMIMYGDEELASPVRFRAYNNLTGNVEEITEQTTFNPLPLGTFSSPYVMHLTQTEAITYTYSNEYAIYPNPVRDKLYIAGAIDDIKNLSIFSTDGTVVARFNSITTAGVLVDNLIDGTYLVVIETTLGTKHIRKIIKKSVATIH